MLKGIDVIVYDIQCTGVRAYTYPTTLFYMMEEAAKLGIEVIVLDRPNPINGLTVDGPMLEEKWRSYIGYINVPYCHGMTIGELARFFNGEYKDRMQTASDSDERVEALHELSRHGARLDSAKSQYSRTRYPAFFLLYRHFGRAPDPQHRHWLYAPLQDRRSSLGQCERLCRQTQCPKTCRASISSPFIFAPFGDSTKESIAKGS